MAYTHNYIKSVLFFVFFGVVSWTGSFASQPDRGKIVQAYNWFTGLNVMESGLVSLTILDGRTGEVIFSENGKMGMATASTLKNITAATAFHVLGPDFTFKTTLGYLGEIDAQGVLHGDLIIRGTGDPSLGSHRYETAKEEIVLSKWAEAIQQAGIKKINGRILADDLLFGGYQAPNGWTWMDMGNYYGSGVSSLNWRENAVGVVFQPGQREGDPVTIRSTTADISYLNVINELTTGRKGSGDNVYAYSAPYASRIYLRGSHGLDLKKTIEISLPDGAMDLLVQLKSKLLAVGVAHEGDMSTLYDLQSLHGEALLGLEEKLNILNVHESPELSKLIYWFNRVSINMYGEALLKAMAQQLGKNTATSSAAGLVQSFWVEKLGVSAGELRIADGSGLSPSNRVTTNAMAKILAACQQEPWFNDFYESLPVNNGMKMKSGTIGGVLGYAGYHTSADGVPYVFSMLVSNYDGGAQAMRRNMFKLLEVLK